MDLDEIINGAILAEPPIGVFHHVIEEVERAIITKMLTFTDGNQSAAARKLWINRGKLRALIRQYKIVIDKKVEVRNGKGSSDSGAVAG